MQIIQTKAAAPHRICAARLVRALAVASVVLISCLGAIAAESAPAAASDQQQQNPQLEKIARDAMTRYHLKSLIVQVRSGGSNVYTAAFGESMTGVAATPAMHFRNGAMAFTYMSTMLMELVDRKQVKLSAELSDFFPDLPAANRITLKNLANMTSGYADYVYQPELLQGTVLQPFRQWSSEELIHVGITKPMMFGPGENWGYSHTNYVILGRVLEKITRMPLAKGMDEYIFGPMGLKQTRSFSTPEIPQPVLHAFSSERRADLHIPPEVPFYEESTFWNPSWTTAEGAIQITDITDMSKSMEMVGTGKLLSKESYQAQVGPNLVGFGHSDPKCPVCRPNTVAFNYGLGVVNVGPWITQTKNFAGSGATVGYLPAKKLTVSVVTTYKPEAFNEKGDYANTSPEIFISLVNALAPNTIPKPQP